MIVEFKNAKAVALRVTYQEDVEKGLQDAVGFSVFVDGYSAGYFKLEPMPGCCGVVVSTQSNNWRKDVLSSTVFHTLKAMAAKAFGYKTIICTTVADNMPQIVGGSKNGWEWGKEFVNPRTGNKLVIGTRFL